MKRQSPIDRLIEALQIAKKYKHDDYVTHCQHDQLFLVLSPDVVSKEDDARLKELGFTIDYDIYVSSELGSC